MKKFALLIVALMLSLVGCSYANMGPGEQAVVQEGYWMIPTEPTLKGCISPEKNSNEITNHVYRYPARQISWDATGDPGSERGPYVVVSNAKAPADMNVPVVVTFDLTTDCEKLKQFHRDFGTKYSGWLNDDGSVSNGWLELLNYVIGQPLQVIVEPESALLTKKNSDVIAQMSAVCIDMNDLGLGRKEHEQHCGIAGRGKFCPLAKTVVDEVDIAMSGPDTLGLGSKLVLGEVLEANDA